MTMTSSSSPSDVSSSSSSSSSSRASTTGSAGGGDSIQSATPQTGLVTDPARPPASQGVAAAAAAALDQRLVEECHPEWLDEIRFGSYRTAAKLRLLQKRTGLVHIDVWNLIEAVRENGLLDLDPEAYVSRPRLETLVGSLYASLAKRLPLEPVAVGSEAGAGGSSDAVRHRKNVETMASWLLSWLLAALAATPVECDAGYNGDPDAAPAMTPLEGAAQAYDKQMLKVRTLKTALGLLCAGKLVDKLRYLFSILSDQQSGHLVRSRYRTFVYDAVRVPMAVGEKVAAMAADQEDLWPFFAAAGDDGDGGGGGGPSSSSGTASSDNPTAKKVRAPSSGGGGVTVNDFLQVLMADPGPPFLSWLPVLHRISAAAVAAGDAVHGVVRRCVSCGASQFRGLWYTSDTGGGEPYHLCQWCFWRGLIAPERQNDVFKEHGGGGGGGSLKAGSGAGAGGAGGSQVFPGSLKKCAIIPGGSGANRSGGSKPRPDHLSEQFCLPQYPRDRRQVLPVVVDSGMAGTAGSVAPDHHHRHQRMPDQVSVAYGRFAPDRSGFATQQQLEELDDEHGLIARYASDLTADDDGWRDDVADIFDDEGRPDDDDGSRRGRQGHGGGGVDDGGVALNQSKRLVYELERKNQEIMRDIEELKRSHKGHQDGRKDPRVVSELASLRSHKEELEARLEELQGARRDLMTELEELMKLLRVQHHHHHSRRRREGPHSGHAAPSSFRDHLAAQQQQQQQQQPLMLPEASSGSFTNVSGMGIETRGHGDAAVDDAAFYEGNDVDDDHAAMRQQANNLYYYYERSRNQQQQPLLLSGAGVGHQGPLGSLLGQQQQLEQLQQQQQDRQQQQQAPPKPVSLPRLHLQHKVVVGGRHLFHPQVGGGGGGGGGHDLGGDVKPSSAHRLLHPGTSGASSSRSISHHRRGAHDGQANNSNNNSSSSSFVSD